MPRIRQDNDARYALRASFTDQFGNVLEGDTIVIEQPGLGSVFAHYKWSDKEDSTDDKKISIDSQSDYTLATKLFIGTKTQNDVQAANLMDAYLTENTVVYIQKNKDSETYVAVKVTSPTFVEFDKYREYNIEFVDQGTVPLVKDDEVGVVLVNGTGSANDPRISNDQINNWDTVYSWYVGLAGDVTSTDVTNWNTAYSWGDHAAAGYTTVETGGYSGTYNIPVRINNEMYVSPTAGGVTITGSTGQITTPAHGNSSQWNTAYSWGNHAAAGYASSSSVGGGAQYVDVSISNYGTIKVDDDRSVGWAGYAIRDDWVFMSDGPAECGLYNDTDNHWAILTYRNARTDIFYSGTWRVRTSSDGADINGRLGVSGNLNVTGTLSGSGYNKSNWDTAYSWGNHAAQGYTTYNGSDAVKTTYNSSLNSDSRNSRGVTRLYRRDDNSDYNVQHHWTGAHWHLRGYAGDSFHAECRVSYADVAGSVTWANVSGKPTIPTNNNQLTNGAGYITSSGSCAYATSAGSAGTSSQVTINYNNDSNASYQMLWGSGNSVYGTGGITCNPNANTVSATSFYASSWFYSTGATGWYNSTYGGGIRMQDSTWVRVYNNKQFYNENTGGNSIATPGDVVAGYSDIRLKDVEEVENDALTKISGLDSIYYRDNELARELGYSGSERKFGLIAQQVQEVLPEVIKRAPIDMDDKGGSKSGEDYITVDYERVVPLLVAGIKELTSELESVKLELKELRDGSSE